jgi:hypothetical protein
MVTVLAFDRHAAGNELGKVGSILGQICAESANGPKTKFDHLGLLFISYLGCSAIRAID